MIKKFIQYNESIRDKMAPKSDEDLSRMYYNIFNFVNLDTLHPNDPEYIKIAEILDTPINELSIVGEEDGDYKLIDDFFRVLVHNEESVSLEVPRKSISVSGNWHIYPEYKLARWVSHQLLGDSYWIFSKKYFDEKFNNSRIFKK